MKVEWLPLKRWLWIHTRWHVREVAYAFGGIGDELMLTAVAAEAKRRGQPFHLFTTRPEIWIGNSDILGIETNTDWWFYGYKRKWTSARIVHVGYTNGIHRHLAQQMAEHFGLTLPDGWRPILKHAAAPRQAKRLVVQNSCRGALFSCTTKEWPEDRWVELIERLAPDFEIIQIGTLSDPKLDQAQDLRGKTTLHEAADLLATAGCFVGLESGLMHVAAATSTPSVIIYGGRTRPHETGYPANTNLFRDPGCAGCGLNANCPNGMKCMEISVEEVLQAVRQKAALGDG